MWFVGPTSTWPRPEGEGGALTVTRIGTLEVVSQGRMRLSVDDADYLLG